MKTHILKGFRAGSSGNECKQFHMVTSWIIISDRSPFIV